MYSIWQMEAYQRQTIFCCNRKFNYFFFSSDVSCRSFSNCLYNIPIYKYIPYIHLQLFITIFYKKKNDAIADGTTIKIIYLSKKNVFTPLKKLLFSVYVRGGQAEQIYNNIYSGKKTHQQTCKLYCERNKSKYTRRARLMDELCVMTG